jgi:hypothetical protein
MDFGFRAAFSRRVIVSGIALAAIAGQLVAQTPRPKTGDDSRASVPLLATLVSRAPSELADVVERFTADQQSLSRRYDANESPAQRRRMREFYTGWRAQLGELNFDKLAQEGRVDYVLLDNYLQHQIALLDARKDARRSGRPSSVRGPFARVARHATRAVADQSAADRAHARHRHASGGQPTRLFEAPSGRGGGRRRHASR